MTGQERVGVRACFSDEAVWRETLGGAEPLHIFSMCGSLDAPENMTAGGMRATGFGPMTVTSYRGSQS
jgi:hypothetical protein